MAFIMSKENNENNASSQYLGIVYERAKLSLIFQLYSRLLQPLRICFIDAHDVPMAALSRRPLPHGFCFPPSWYCP